MAPPMEVNAIVFSAARMDLITGMALGRIHRGLQIINARPLNWE